MWVSLCWVVGCHPYLLTSSTIKSQKHFTLRDARLPLEPSEQTTKRQKQREKNIPNSSFPDCLLTELAAKPQPEMETQGSSFTKKNSKKERCHRTHPRASRRSLPTSEVPNAICPLENARLRHCHHTSTLEYLITAYLIDGQIERSHSRFPTISISS